MALEMKVYRDPAAFEAKIMFGRTWRQIIALAIGVPISLALYGLTAWILVQQGQDWTQATNTAMPVMVACLIPFAVYGWWRPRGLMPETYLAHIIAYQRHSKELSYGTDHAPRAGRSRAGRGLRGRRSDRIPHAPEAGRRRRGIRRGSHRAG